jgi:hypothetical protein
VPGRYTVVVSPLADAELQRMIERYPLDPDTRSRLRERLAVLERFPFVGRDLPQGKWEGHQLLFGPFAWMASVYRVENSVVRVVTIEDCRRAGAASGA